MTSPPVDTSRQGARRWLWRAAIVLSAFGLYRFLHWQRARPANLPLETVVDGPRPSEAAGMVVYLHGRGRSNWDSRSFVRALREAGLPDDVAIVRMEAPYTRGFGHNWGDTWEEQATSRARVRARLAELLKDGGPPPARVVIAGFSQGAGLAIDTVADEPRVGALASLSPCMSALRGELPKREARILLAHGDKDASCPVEESRSLARALEAAKKPVRYLEFEGGHAIPAEVIRAVVELARGG